MQQALLDRMQPVHCRTGNQARPAGLFLATDSDPIALVSTAGDAVPATPWANADITATAWASYAWRGREILARKCGRLSFRRAHFGRSAGCGVTRGCEEPGARPNLLAATCHSGPALFRRSDVITFTLLDAKRAFLSRLAITWSRGEGLTTFNCALLFCKANATSTEHQEGKQSRAHRNLSCYNKCVDRNKREATISQSLTRKQSNAPETQFQFRPRTASGLAPRST